MIGTPFAASRPKKQLEQKFIAGRIVLERQGKPLPKANAPCVSQQILLTPLFGCGGWLARLDQAFGGQSLEEG